MTKVRKKLIEVSIPLEAINVASTQRSLRQGYPRPCTYTGLNVRLPRAEAVLFAQLVDDPSAWPERFPNEEMQNVERKRLHKVIERMVPWDASNNEAILNDARWEIARSVAWGLGEEPPPMGDGKAILEYLQTKAPPVFDPFSGGGSIPLEAQRLGLRAYGSDLNPVAVLIGKALIEIPPKFSGHPPVNVKARAEGAKGGRWNGKGAQGLAEDVRYYGLRMRDEAQKRIGHFYPKVEMPDGSEAMVIAWLWARTVRSPDPVAKGAMVPLVSSFMLSTKKDKKAWAEPVIDPTAPDGWRFEVSSGPLSKADEEIRAEGTKSGRAMFRCVLTGANIGGAYIDEEAQAGRMSARLMAIVANANGERSRTYLSPTAVHEQVAEAAAKYVAEHSDEMDLPLQGCRGTFASNAQGRIYCFKTFADYFTPRQLVALTTLSDLVGEARDEALADARAAGLLHDDVPLCAGGSGASAYADAVATYLAFAVDRAADYGSSLATWLTDDNAIRGTFGRQALQMAWDFCEGSYFGSSSAALTTILRTISDVIAHQVATGLGSVEQMDASKNGYAVRPCLINTDPPYYDNIGYADLTDFFYVWLRRSLSEVWPTLFRRLTTPKTEELIATEHRHGGRSEAEEFFINGMSRALRAMYSAAS